MTTIRPLTIEELPACVDYAKAFHEEMGLPGQLTPEVFLRNWTTFLTNYTAVIFGLWDDEVLVGGLGALLVPDLSDGRLCASELFIFIDRAHRGGSGFLRLLHAYKHWAINHQAVEVRVAYTEHDDTDAQLDRVYRKLGYRPIERSYLMPLAGGVPCPL